MEKDSNTEITAEYSSDTSSSTESRSRDSRNGGHDCDACHELQYKRKRESVSPSAVIKSIAESEPFLDANLIQEFSGNFNKLKTLEKQKTKSYILDGQMESGLIHRNTCIDDEIIKKYFMQTNNILAMGDLEKHSPTAIKGWQTRYFALTKNNLAYWKCEKDYKAKKYPKGIIPFQRVCVTLDV